MTNKIIKAALTLCVLALAAGCGKAGTVDPSSVVKSSFTDLRDGQEYRTVKIGKQVWMAENLNYKADSSWCYDNDTVNCGKYGRLYNWDAAMKACPVFWRLPDTADWDNLILAVGGEKIAGKRLRSEKGWKKDGNGTDDYGFSALPSGWGYYGNSFRCSGDCFGGDNYKGYWWSATENGSYNAWRRYMYYDFDYVNLNYDFKVFRFAVRCVRDA